MSVLTYTTSPDCRHETHDECANRRAVVVAGIVCLCKCHPSGDDDPRPFRQPHAGHDVSRDGSWCLNCDVAIKGGD